MEKQEAINELHRLKEVSLRMGGEERIEKQHKRARLTARERIGKLFDPETFVESDILRHNMTPDSEGKRTHIGRISGYGRIGERMAIVHAEDATVSGGAGVGIGPGMPKGLNPELHPEVCLPIVTLIDGTGFDENTDMSSFGIPPNVYTQRELSIPRRVPHIVAIMGDCLGTSSLVAAKADFAVMVKGTSLALTEPSLLGFPPEEESIPEELGGWKLQAEITGQVDTVAEDDEHCLQIIREFLSYMPLNCNEEPPCVSTSDPPDRKTEKLMGLIPDKANRVYDMLRVIKQIVDDGKYFQIKPDFGKALITCLARLNGRTVGIIANQTFHHAGAAGPDECDKASDFIILCDTFNIPIIFIADTPGHLVGRIAEEYRIPTKIMTWMQALAFSTVPNICLIVRKAYGMAISNMCGSNCGPDFIAALTTAEISFMSPEAAANVVYLRRIEQAEDPEAEREKLIREMEYQSAPWPAAAVGLLDDVIDPRDTRKYLIDRLEFLRECKGDFISEKHLQHWPTGF